jgi:hypothetical protein
MEPASALPFAAWESFYVIIGSSAAALTGLQFVVIALVAESRARATIRSARAWGTPTVVHFGAVLLNAAILSAPWRRTSIASWAIAAFAAVGLGYTLLVIRHARQQHDYAPVLEDWICHVILPLIAYAALLVGGVVLDGGSVETCLFVIGTAALLLLFVGIHNAWDAVTYIALARRKGREAADATARPESSSS